MTTTTRRTLAIMIPLFALQITACADGPFAPDNNAADPAFLIGGSPLLPFSVAKAPVLETKRTPKGKVSHDLVVELDVTSDVADALEHGMEDWTSSAAFWLNGDFIALADPRPSPVAWAFGDKDGTSLVVIAMPVDDATWLQIDGAVKSGQTVDVSMEIDLLSIDSHGGTSVVHSVDAAGSFAK